MAGAGAPGKLEQIMKEMLESLIKNEPKKKSKLINDK